MINLQKGLHMKYIFLFHLIVLFCFEREKLGGPANRFVDVQVRLLACSYLNMKLGALQVFMHNYPSKFEVHGLLRFVNSVD